MLELHLDVLTEWRLEFTFVDGSRAELPFSGGIDPRDWLALHLANEYGFTVQASVETARALFEGFLPSPVDPGSPEPCGMHGPDT
jgi:hypothetical protein